MTADGLVTPDEKSAVDALVQTLETAKETAAYRTVPQQR
ncbi:hypothetical protein [Staphylococcus ureilyticus]